MDFLHVRVQDVNFCPNDILVTDGKKANDRITGLSESLKPVLGKDLGAVKTVHEKDLVHG